MKYKLVDTEATIFYQKLALTIRKRYRLVAILIALCSFVSVLDSIFFRTFYSKAVILIPVQDHSKLYKTQPFDIQSNERYMLTQKKAISSGKVLKNALSSLHSDQEITKTSIESLRSSLSVKGMPLNNSITLHIEGIKPDDTRSFLSAIIQSYKNWFRVNLAQENKHLNYSQPQKIEKYKREHYKLAETENSLGTFEDSDSKMLHDLKVNRPEQLNKDIQKSTHREREKRILQRDIELEQQDVKQLDKDQHNIELLTSRNVISIEVLTSPSIPMSVNPFWQNLLYGFTAGLCMSFLILYLLAVHYECSVDEKLSTKI